MLMKNREKYMLLKNIGNFPTNSVSPLTDATLHGRYSPSTGEEENDEENEEDGMRRPFYNLNKYRGGSQYDRVKVRFNPAVRNYYNSGSKLLTLKL
jgi:hypothetical protein